MGMFEDDISKIFGSFCFDTLLVFSQHDDMTLGVYLFSIYASLFCIPAEPNQLWS